MLDINYNGTSSRLAPEAPIPVIQVNNITYKLGGATNVANNLMSLGINTFVVGVVGSDNNKDILFNKLIETGLSTEYIVIDKTRNTTAKNRTFIENRIVGRFDIESTEWISEPIEEKIINNILHIISKNKISTIVLSDYMKGVLSYNLTPKIIQIANTHNIHIFVDPKDKKFKKYIGVTCIKPNKSEAEMILGHKIMIDDSSLKKACSELLKVLNCKILLITLSENGLVIANINGIFKHIPVQTKKNIIDVTGAGDTVLSAFIYSFIESNNLIESAEFANYCGQIKISNIGTYSITKTDILKFKNKNVKLIEQTHLSEFVGILKNDNKKIIFTNGCFDILHYGHILYLEEAKKLGDILIIGLNSDNSIRKNKGNNRPINNLKYRLKQLESLLFVDYIVVFDDDTPHELVKIIKPDILVKGGDYKVENIVGKEYALDTKVLHYEKDVSSTLIWNKLDSK